MLMKELILANRAMSRKSQKPVTEAGAARDPKKFGVKSIVQTVGGSGRGGFEESPVDLDQISRAYQTEAYIRRAIDRIVGMTFKQGWELKSKNQKASDYVWMRMKLMEEATRQSWDGLMAEMMHNLVLYSNSSLVKVRTKSKVSVPGLNATGYTSKQPIAGYFPVDPVGLKVERDEFGNVTGYQQDSAGSAIPFKVEDIIHMTYKKPTGRAYGVPYISRSLDDILMLRMIEDNVARLIHRNLFPLQIYQVGLPQAGFEADDTEIENIKVELQNMPLDGMLVVPERHNIKTIGSESVALDASNYLKYFRQRVFSGLGMSDSTMGIGDTANRSTSDNMSADLTDLAKDFQRTFAQFFQKEVINELLFEGGFDPTLNPEDEVVFVFNEIEQDAKVKRENHIVQLFLSNVIDQDEVRRELGYDPLTDISKLSGMLLNAAKPQEENQQNMTAAEQSADAAKAQGNNKDQPENQHGKQTSPGKSARSEKTLHESEKTELTEGGQLVTLLSEPGTSRHEDTLVKTWQGLKLDVIARLEKGEDLEVVRGFTTKIIEGTFSRQVRQLAEASWYAENVEGATYAGDLRTRALSRISEGASEVGKRMIQDLDKSFENGIAIEDVESVFARKDHRLRLIAKMEASRAQNLARAITAYENGESSLQLIVSETACALCKDGAQIDLTTEQWIEELPPHHPGCACVVHND